MINLSHKSNKVLFLLVKIKLYSFIHNLNFARSEYLSELATRNSIPPIIIILMVYVCINYVCRAVFKSPYNLLKLAFTISLRAEANPKIRYTYTY